MKIWKCVCVRLQPSPPHFKLVQNFTTIKSLSRNNWHWLWFVVFVVFVVLNCANKHHLQQTTQIPIRKSLSRLLSTSKPLCTTFSFVVLYYQTRLTDHNTTIKYSKITIMYGSIGLGIYISVYMKTENRKHIIIANAHLWKE